MNINMNINMDPDPILKLEVNYHEFTSDRVRSAVCGDGVRCAMHSVRCTV